MSSSKFVFLILSFLVLILNCKDNPVSDDRDFEPFYLKYDVIGGHSGGYDFELSQDDSILYLGGPKYKIAATYDQQQFLYNLFTDNHFLELDSVYENKDIHVDDGQDHRITFESELGSNTIFLAASFFTRDNRAMYPEIDSLVQKFSGFISDLHKTIDFGFVSISSENTLYEWPFSETIKLSENELAQIEPGEAVFNFFKEESFLKENIGQDLVFYEDQSLYRIRYVADFNKDFSEQDAFLIYGIKKIPFKVWSNDAPLEDLADTSLFIEGDFFNEVRTTSIEGGLYSEDNSLAHGKTLYKLGVQLGNIPD